ncbi:single-stranded-DNA-specific exonuclease RecJ [Candidatus Saccharibacteria bacterium]|nr:single-stranded-DNA-specific exonuclease RecJ [Candidatus Saccharibacteria bacterium]
MRYSALFLKLLEKRGFEEDFLYPKYENLADPFLLPDMKGAVGRIEKAIKEGEKILIYGDYDVDGVTATAIMREALLMAGASAEQIVTMLPNRFTDGYGMSTKVVRRAKEGRVGLIITVDCGSNNGEVIEVLSGEGFEVVVTDHHEVMGELPQCVAVVNPKRKDIEVEKGLKCLSGAGVAFFLARALMLRGLILEGQEKWLLDFAMIGTICDAMKLTGENRIICKFGGIVLAKTRRKGLKELMKIAGVKKIDADAIGFQIGPRLNAAGRMESPELALRLLTTDSGVEAAELAEKLESLNAERKRQQESAVTTIEKQGVPEEPVIVVSGDWHEGVLGIIAGNLTEKYKKPSFALTEAEDGIVKGSGRSFGEFNLAEALAHCGEHLLGGGGHAEACGVKLERAKLADFKREVNDYYRSLKLKNQERFLEEQEDLRLKKFSALSLDFMGELQLLEPFGEGNPEPKILLENVEVEYADRMGAQGNHLKLTVRDQNGERLKLVAFRAREEWFEINRGEIISVLTTPMVNEWNGVSSVEGRIIKINQTF